LLFTIPIFIIIVDQITKFLAVKYLKGKGAFVIFEDFLRFYYVENYGAAFGMLKDKRVFFIIVTLLVVFSVVFL